MLRSRLQFPQFGDATEELHGIAPLSAERARLGLIERLQSRQFGLGI